MNKAGMDLLKSLESCRLTPYRDKGGNWTNGWGNTHNVDPAQYMTQEKADADLDANVANTEKLLSQIVSTWSNLDENEQAALTILTYNIGSGEFASSTVLRALRMGDKTAAANAFMRFVFVRDATTKNLEPSDDLYFRRKAERALFLTPVT